MVTNYFTRKMYFLKMKIGILNIGDELLAGKILNTNSYSISQRLYPLGHEVIFTSVIPDGEEALAKGLQNIFQNYEPDFLIITGGLGPTQDDLTRQGIARFLKKPLEESAEAKIWLTEFLLKYYSKELSVGQLMQILIPVGSKPLRNPKGTACGFAFTFEATSCFAFPGVPMELDAMLALHVLPLLQANQILLTRQVWTWGWSESDQRLALADINFQEINGDFRFSSLPREEGVLISLSILAVPQDQNDRDKQLQSIWDKILKVIPSEKLISAVGDNINVTVQNLLLRLEAKVAVAESCTGGGLGFLLTETPGSSAIFEKGFLTYSNQAKQELLGVSSQILDQFGAVSQEVVTEMLRGCLQKSGSDFACAISGIAGPDGGTTDKPVGTVWIAVGDKDGIHSRKLQLKGDRMAIRWRSAYTTLNELRLFLQEKCLNFKN